MAVTAMAGIVAWGPQPGKTTTATTFYKHKATLVDLAVQDDTRLGAPEIGGDPIPSFPYKAGVMVGGGFTIQPRLEDTIGWLLYAAMGAVSSTLHTTGVTEHTFGFNATDSAATKWLSARKYIPMKDGSTVTDLREVYTDCKIVGMAFTLANDAPITTRVDLIGRSFTIDTSTAWTFANTSYEGFASIPIGCVVGGFIELPTFSTSTTKLAVQAATVTWANTPLDIRQERVFGSPYIDDVTTIMRQLTFDIVVKWNDPDLYKSILTGATNGTSWTSVPFTSSLQLLVMSPGDISGATGHHFELEINAANVMLQQAEGISLAGNNAVVSRFTGTAVQPADTSAYCTIKLRNDAAAYTWA